MKKLLLVLFSLLLGCSREVIEPQNQYETPKKVEKIPENNHKPATKLPRKLTFAVQYIDDLDCATSRDVLYIDLFDYSAEEISNCRKDRLKINKDSKILCYFSSQAEEWRPDWEDMEPHIGNELDGWPEEYWLKVNPETKKVFLNRMSLAKEKGCDGVDVDNVDGYSFSEEDRGFSYTFENAIKFVNWLIASSTKLNLSFSLKNSMSLIQSGELLPFAYAMNEQCYQYNECDSYELFNGSLFIIRYKRRCPKNVYSKGHTLLKKMGLGVWDRTCL